MLSRIEAPSVKEEFYFTQNSVGEELHQRIKGIDPQLIKAKSLDILLDVDSQDLARMNCLPVSFAVGINFLLNRAFFSAHQSEGEFSMGDFWELAILCHRPPDHPTIANRSGTLYYAFLLDVARRLGFSGQVVTNFESCQVFIEPIRNKGIGLVSLDNQVVTEVTLKDYQIHKKLRIGRHIFLLHGLSENPEGFLYSDVFNPIPEQTCTINLWTQSSTVNSYLVTPKEA